MSEYKRMTKQAGWHKDIDLKDELGYSYIYQRLAELENKIEQGTLIELPCKVGDTIYVIRKNGIEEREVRRFHIGRGGWYAVYYGTTLWDSCDRLGKAWFLTREEAENKLKELKNG